MIRDLWYKNAIIYSVDVETFMDGDGDGVGDFRGLGSRLEYLASLGVTCIWLLPFYRTPNRDNGYDVTDYYSIDPRLGDLGDFVAFSQRARMHGMRVMVDLVVNHTSDQHPWFQSARSDPSSRYRDYYVWSRERPEETAEPVFPGVQKSTWTYDEQAQAYYFHRFFEFQPDLNIANPAVREEIMKIMGFWLELGVSGFRVDAVPFLIEHQGASSERTDSSHDFLTDMRNFLSWRRGDAVLLAEANVTMDEAARYFGGGQRMQLAFNFIVNQALFLSFAEHDARPVKRALESTLHLPTQAQWANFLRNHDELDLARLTDEERARVFSAFGPDPDMQIFDRGLRRRLAPMFDDDPARLACAYSLLLTLPGTPVLWYGEEIGMGELLALEGRMSVRTPMQWSGAQNAGFSGAHELVRPVVADGPHGFPSRNVVSQRSDQDSLFSTVQRLIWSRRECAAIGWGAWTLLPLGRDLLGIEYESDGDVLVALHNFAAEPRALVLERPVRATTWFDVLHGKVISADDDRKLRLELPGYGYLWLRAGEREDLCAEPR